MEERIRLDKERQENRTSGAVSSGEDSTSTDGDSEPDFEFEFPSLLGRDHGSPAPADDLFADGRIRPAAFYPVFGRRPSARASSAGDLDCGLAPAAAPEPRTRGQLGRLFLEETRAWNSSSSSSSTGSTASTSSLSSAATTDDGDGGLEGAAPESYCVWAPGGGGGKPSESPRPPRGGKSGSTGSSVARWRRISDLVVGRSQSDGKEKFLFLPVNPPAPPPKQQDPKPKPRPRPPNAAAGGTKKKGSEIGTVAAAHRMAYGAKASAGVTANGATPRRTFLPYREELVGFFANVNGISRSHAHPY